MFMAFFSDDSVFRCFRTLKEAKEICASVGAIRIVSLRSGREFWLGVDY